MMQKEHREYGKTIMESRLVQALRESLNDLKKSGTQSALIGGLAVSVHTEPQFTRDVDIAVSVTNDDQAKQIIHPLMQLQYTIATSIEQKRVGRLACVRLQKNSSLLMDLLFASSGIEPEIVDQAETLEILPDIQVPIANIGHLIALKILSNNKHRPQDELDLKKLIEVANSAELIRAETGLALITSRGYHRDRNLQDLLRQRIATAEKA